ncbi:MAG TPA: DUF2851 family protein [Dehalococcoidia bacterium]|nr:DUF2851 family protein [Dehalococcoidia bacterium]
MTATPTNSSVLAEPRRPAARRRGALRERELSRLWQEQRLAPEALVTADGAEVEVIYRGRRGLGPGPDFRDAVIRLTPRPPLHGHEEGESTDGLSFRGDVELHVRSSDFRRHGHHEDRAYLRLALHVVFEDDGGPVTLLDGRVVPTVALGRWVQRRAGEIRLALASPEPYREPCHSAQARLGADHVRGVLREAGRRRLREHAAPLGAWIHALGAEEALYVALARALGLTRNTAAFEQLARALPLAELRAVAARAGDPQCAVEGLLLGTAGLLEPQLSLWPDHGDGAAARRWAAWQAAGAPAVPDLVFAGGERPGCSPRERLLGLAALSLRSGPPLDATMPEWPALLAAGPKALLAALQVGGSIGRDRAIELAVNAVLPWLLAAHGADADLAAAVFAAYEALPASASYGATRPLTAALRTANGRSLLRGAAATQGALALTRDWCTQGGCGRCPLS